MTRSCQPQQERVSVVRAKICSSQVKDLRPCGQFLRMEDIVTANLLTKRKERVSMKRFLMPASSISTKKVAFVILACAVLTLLAAPAMADVCSTAFPQDAGCGVTITITGTSGHLTATFGGSGIPYDNVEDQLVGVVNDSSVAVGAIVLSGPNVGENVFAFDGDGPCAHFGTLPCGPDPVDYQGPNNTFVGISSDFTTGKVLFTAPLRAPTEG